MNANASACFSGSASMSGGLFADLDLRHCDLLLAALSIDLPKHDI
jgi:hypothetical protein